ncbi:MAG: hypothetical protein ACO3JL_13490, partial [Myxococcota bacterium]
MKLLRRHPWLFAAAALVAMGLGLVELATSPPSLRFTTERLTARLEAEFGLSLRIGELYVDPTTAKVELDAVALVDRDGVEVFSAERIRAKLAPLPFFSRRLQLDSLEVEAPRLWVRVDEDGRLQGIRLPENPVKSEDPLLRLDVKRFRVFDGQLRVSQAGKIDAQLSGVSVRLRDHDEDAHQLRFRVANGSITRPGDIVELEKFGGLMTVHGDGLLAPDRVHLSEVLLVTEGASVSIGGDVLLEERGKVPALDLDVNAVVPLGPVLAHAALPVEVEGALSIGARVMADAGLARPRATGQADVAELRLDGFGLGSFSGRFLLDEERAEFLSVAYRTGDTTLQGEAVVFFDESLAFQFRVSGADFSLHRLLADLKIPGAWADLQIDAEAVGHGVLRPSFDLQGHARGQLHDLRVGGANVRTLPDEQLVLHVKDPILSDFDIHATAEKLRLSGTLDDASTTAAGFVDFYFGADKGFVVEMESERVSFASIGGRIGKLEFSGLGGAQLRIAGPYRRPDIHADAWLQGFNLEGYSFGDLEGHIHYDAGVLALEDVRARKGPSTYSGDVTLDFGAEREVRTSVGGAASGVALSTVQGLAIDVDISLDRARAEDLRAIVPPRYATGVLGFLRELEFSGPLMGTVQAQGYIGDGTTDHLTGSGELSLEEGTTLLGQTLHGGSGRFVLDEDRFSIEGLNIAVAGGTSVMTAVIERAGGKLTGDLVVRGLQLGEVDALKGTSRAFIGTLDLEGSLSHLAEDPTLVGRARLRDAAWGDIPIGGADLAVSHIGRKLSLLGPILSRRGDGVIAVDTRSPFPYTASLHVFPGDVQPLLPATLLPEGMRIEAAGNIDVGGELRSFSESRGTIALEPVTIALRTLRLRATGDVLAHFRGTRIIV